jgi:hypothetical protein
VLCLFETKIQVLLNHQHDTTIALSQLQQVNRPFIPLSKLVASRAEFREVPGTKKGGTIAIAHLSNRPVVYLDELVIKRSALN